jgi:hypothetical protein
MVLPRNTLKTKLNNAENRVNRIIAITYPMFDDEKGYLGLKKPR